MLLTLSITLIGNLLYFYLEATGRFNLLAPRFWMLIARFVMGLGACDYITLYKYVFNFDFCYIYSYFKACAAVIRSYVASATNVEERTSVLANISACQGLGFIL